MTSVQTDHLFFASHFPFLVFAILHRPGPQLMLTRRHGSWSLFLHFSENLENFIKYDVCYGLLRDFVWWLFRAAELCLI